MGLATFHDQGKRSTGLLSELSIGRISLIVDAAHGLGELNLKMTAILWPDRSCGATPPWVYYRCGSPLFCDCEPSSLSAAHCVRARTPAPRSNRGDFEKLVSTDACERTSARDLTPLP